MNQDDTAPKLPNYLFTESARVGDLRVDHTYQRSLSEAWIRRFLPVNGKPARETYDRRAIGIPAVSWRDNGNGPMYLLDGQHRAALVERIEGPDTTILVAVYAGLSLVQEAQYFTILNKDRALRPAERLHSDLAALKPEALAILSELNRQGYTVEGQPIAGGLVSLRFVAGLEKMIQFSGRPGLRRIVSIVKQSWPDDHRHATEYPIWNGVWALMQHYHPDVDFDGRLIAKLQAHPAIYYVQQAVVSSDQGSNSKGVAVARVMVRVYNTRQSPKYRLPDWESVSGREHERRTGEDE